MFSFLVPEFRIGSSTGDHSAVQKELACTQLLLDKVTLKKRAGNLAIKMAGSYEKVARKSVEIMAGKLWKSMRENS
jgi:hypothetical protein